MGSGMVRQKRIEYEIYVPAPSADGGSASDLVLEKARQELTEVYGGLTDTRQRNEGVWKIGGVTMRDEIVIWKILSQKGEVGDDFMKEVQLSLEKSLAQDKILVVRREVETL